MKHNVKLGRELSSIEYRECDEFCLTNFGKRGQDWTSVWINGTIYGFRKESYAVLFALKFIK
jgi:hypothetical protein